ncbi:hypothetical protein H9P43_002749 [Blastocladiella emersonii ATCC 22665]|nr:hypothetical protein H9P43_002749 [Blastocladiella emersonii ATCC 22665]
MSFLVYGLALYTSSSLFVRTRTKYYAVLSGLAIGRIFIAACLLASLASPGGVPIELTRFSSVVEGTYGVTFISLNALRMYRTCYLKHKRPVQVLLTLTGITLTMQVIATIWFLVATWNTYDMYDGPAIDFYLAWSITDAAVNSVISLFFVYFLRQLAVAPTGIASMRSEMVDLIRHIQVILVGEVSLALFASIGRLADPKFDPSWYSVILADAVRLRTFSSFLSGLNRVMKRAVVAAALQVLSSGWFLAATWNGFMESDLAVANTLYFAWSCVDAVVNSGISITFVEFLRDLSIAPAGGMTMRGEMAGLIQRVQALLVA